MIVYYCTIISNNIVPSIIETLARHLTLVEEKLLGKRMMMQISNA